MKKNQIFISILAVMLALVANAQKRKDTMFMQRGPLEPINQEYKNVKTYNLKISVPDNFSTIMSKNRAAIDISYLQEKIPIWGLKSTIDGELRVKYNITQFEYLDNRTIQRAPAWSLGIEANVEVFDAQGKLLYKRYQIPKANTYIINPDSDFGSVVNYEIALTFIKLFKDFEHYYLYQPAWSAYYFEFDKLDKLSKKEDPAPFNEFNQSSQVFPTINMVNREDWPKLFGEAQKYWESLLNYDKNKEEGTNKDFRLFANASLATSYMLTGDIEKAQSYMKGIKENDSKFFGIYANYDNFEKALNKINEAKAEANTIVDFEPIQKEPVLPSFLMSKDAFRFVIIEGEAINTDNEKFTGKIKIINDNPPRIDLRTVQTGSGVGAMFSSLKTDNNTVLIEEEEGKKPKKMKLDDLKTIKTKEGKTYVISQVGSILGGDKRYAILEEIQSSPALTLSKELFPYSNLLLKKPNDEEFYSLPPLGIKKSLSKYFENCPAMQENIKAGRYNSSNDSNYLQIYQDYLSKCK